MPLAEAVSAATANPAAVLGLAARGSLEVGQRADVVALDGCLVPVFTLVGGAPVGERSDHAG